MNNKSKRIFLDYRCCTQIHPPPLLTTLGHVRLADRVPSFLFFTNKPSASYVYRRSHIHASFALSFGNYKIDNPVGVLSGRLAKVTYGVFETEIRHILTFEGRDAYVHRVIYIYVTYELYTRIYIYITLRRDIVRSPWSFSSATHWPTLVFIHNNNNNNNNSVYEEQASRGRKFSSPLERNRPQ